MFIQYRDLIIKNLKFENVNLNYLKWFKDEEIKKFIVKSNISTLEDLKKYYLENKLKKDTLLLGIFLNQNHIGNIKINFEDDRKRKCFIGILIGEKKYRNKGIGKKSLELVIKKINDIYQTYKFKLGVNFQNLKAINSYKNAGFLIKNKKKNFFIMEKNYKELDFYKFSLGTAQMGMPYGVVNKMDVINMNEFKKIFEYSKKFGIHSLDTSPRYGDVSKKISKLNLSDWQITTKLLPANLIRALKNKYFYLHSFKETLKNLKVNSINTILIHKPKDLITEKNYIFKALDEIKKTGKIKKVGLSLNSPEDFYLAKKYPFDVIQTPLSFFDQRILKKNKLDYLVKKGIEIQARSIFLQGLALCKTSTLPKKFKKFNYYWKKRDEFLKKKNLSSKELAINFINQNNFINKIIFGVNSLSQLKSILKTKKKFIGNVKKLSIENKKIISPYLW